MQLCPCGRAKPYEKCCGIFITGQAIPTSPVDLMRSRYTAYTQANIDYIMKTMKSPAADNFDPQAAKAWAQQVEWLKLDVIRATQDQDKGHVEFMAYFLDNKTKQAIHELSEFHLVDGVWYYVRGTQPKPLAWMAIKSV
jgi:SEC-C motif-containing protein